MRATHSSGGRRTVRTEGTCREPPALGYKPKTNTNPLEALGRLKVEFLDVIITDLRMPAISGTEFAQRAHKINPDSGISLLTAYQVGLDDGPQAPFIDGILGKPCRAGIRSDSIAEFARRRGEIQPYSPV